MTAPPLRAEPRSKRSRGKWLLLLAAVVLVITGGSVTLAVRHRRQVAVDAVVADACRLPTDAAGRQYLRQRANAGAVNYIDGLSAMYRRCPDRAVPGATAGRPAPGAPRSRVAAPAHTRLDTKAESDDDDESHDGD